MSTYSTLKIELIGTGEQSGTWGTTTNTNLGTAIEEAIVGSADVTFSSADVTLTLTDTNATQIARHLRLNLTGTSGGARNLILGSGCQIDKPYLINNGLADTVTVKNTTGNGIAVPAGKTMWVYNNGTDVVDAVTHLSSLTLSTALPIASGGTGTTSTTFVNLATNVTGDLPFSNLAQGSALSVLGVTGNATADVGSIAASTDDQVLRRSGTSVAFGAINLASSNAVTGDLPLTNIAQIAGLSVAGRSANTTGDLAAITAAADHNVLRRSGTSIGFGAIDVAQSGAVTGTLAVGNGGTGAATFTANNVLLGNGASAFQVVAPGTTGNVLTSNGTTWVSATPVGGPITINNKTGAYTVISSDFGEIINCTANTFTVSLTAAATLGAGFYCWIWNTSTSTITIDPDSAETIDGVSTITLRPGEGTQVVCDGTNWLTGDKKTMRGYSENMSAGLNRPSASGNRSVAIGQNSLSSGQFSFAAGGTNVTASATNALALGSNTTASATFATAIGSNSGNYPSQAVTGSGAMALGGSYASGTDAFAAAIVDNTSSYGATNSNSVAIGYLCKATGSYSFALGYTNISSGTGSFAFGSNSTASGQFSSTFGDSALANIYGKSARASGGFSSVVGTAQAGNMVLRCETTNATPTVLTSDSGAASTTNQIILPNDSTFAFSILVVARRADGDNESAGYKFEGVVDRNGAANTTAIVGTVTKTVLAEDTAAWDVSVTADTTNGGLKIEATGEAGKTIRWVATSWTSEVTG